MYDMNYSSIICRWLRERAPRTERATLPYNMVVCNITWECMILEL